MFRRKKQAEKKELRRKCKAAEDALDKLSADTLDALVSDVLKKKIAGVKI